MTSIPLLKFWVPKVWHQILHSIFEYWKYDFSKLLFNKYPVTLFNRPLQVSPHSVEWCSRFYRDPFYTKQCTWLWRLYKLSPVFACPNAEQEARQFLDHCPVCLSAGLHTHLNMSPYTVGAPRANILRITPHTTRALEAPENKQWLLQEIAKQDTRWFQKKSQDASSSKIPHDFES